MNETQLPITVSYRTLLRILWVAPLAVAFVLIDQLALHGTWHNDTHFTADQVAYWTAILTLPHIVASMIGFADREYLSWYKKPLIRGLVIALSLAFIGQIVIGGYATIIIVACYTMYHNVQQQFGISAMILRAPQTTAFKIMKWLFVIPSALGYMVLMLPPHGSIRDIIPYTMGVMGVLMVIGTVLAVREFRRLKADPATPEIGLKYFAGNIFSLYISFAMLATGYSFLTSLISRLIHDLTAYTIYIAHDHNRHAVAPVNPVYALPARIGLKPAVMCVPIAITISILLLLSVKENANAAGVILGSMNLMHYYMEGHMWKRGTPHRQHVPFV